ncbi:MAG: hypothetical protein SPK76_07890 [Bacteroidales bacterium]|nr:hypothetical protein [Bacteroidales bacterium]
MSNGKLFDIPASSVGVELTPTEVAQIRYKVWKIQQRARGDNVLYNQARLIQQLLAKAERRALRDRKKRLFKD